MWCELRDCSLSARSLALKKAEICCPNKKVKLQGLSAVQALLTTKQNRDPASWLCSGNPWPPILCIGLEQISWTLDRLNQEKQQPSALDRFEAETAAWVLWLPLKAPRISTLDLVQAMLIMLLICFYEISVPSTHWFLNPDVIYRHVL